MNRFVTLNMDIKREMQLTEFAPLLWYQRQMILKTLKTYPYALHEITTSLESINIQFNAK